MRKIEGIADGRGNRAAQPVFVIRVEGASPKKKPKKPRRRWLKIWGAMLAMVFLACVGGAIAAALTNNANAPRQLPPCTEVDPDAVRCDHFRLWPAEPREDGAA
jgi:hypothetical protein